MGGQQVHSIHLRSLAEQPEQQPCALGQPIGIRHRDRRYQRQRHVLHSCLASGCGFEQVRREIGQAPALRIGSPLQTIQHCPANRDGYPLRLAAQQLRRKRTQALVGLEE